MPDGVPLTTDVTDADLCEARTDRPLCAHSLLSHSCVLVHAHGRSCSSCFVPALEPQATMTLRSWRHFSVFWPFMVAGLIGPSAGVELSLGTVDGAAVAPTGSRVRPPRSVASSGNASSSDADCDTVSASSRSSVGDVAGSLEDGWRAASGDDFSVVDEAAGALPNEHVAQSSDFQDYFSEMSVHDAYLETFGQAARLGGMLFGDNVADATAITEKIVNVMEEAAMELGIDSIQTLYGHVNTTKLHRLVMHLGDELRARGNLWEGDTSVNEKLHGSCKRKYKRSNKRGPGVALQMMRREETQSAIIRELCDADEDVGGGAGRIHSVPSGPGNLSDGASDGSEGEGTDCGGHSARGGPSSHVPRSAGAGASGSSSPPPTHTSQLSFKGRGQRVAIRELRRISALASVANTLRMGDQDCVTQHRTMRIVARFEWGAPTAVQHLRAVKSFFGKPCFYFVRYEDAAGALRWGRMHVILPSLGDERRSCAVVQRMRRATTRPGWVLTRYGCVSLAWEFEEGHSSHPALELVDAVRVLRAEDVQVDWYDLGDRLGLRATPSNKHNSAAERRASRFFTSVFYPWKSREQQPGM